MCKCFKYSNLKSKTKAAKPSHDKKKYTNPEIKYPLKGIQNPARKNRGIKKV